MTTEEMAEVLKLANAGRPQVNQTMNFNAPIGQQIAHVDTIEAHFDKDMGMQVTHAENIADKPTIDIEGLKAYFKAPFIGIGQGNIDHFKEIVPLLEHERTGKEVAIIAHMIYQSGKLIETKKPKTFKVWHNIFCQLTGYPYTEYRPAQLTITERLKQEFYML